MFLQLSHAARPWGRVASIRETGWLSRLGWGPHFSRAGETLARSTDTWRTRCSNPSPTLFALRSCNRYTLEPAAADTCIRCKPTHPSPSAREFRLLLNGLARSELRRIVWPKLGTHPVKKCLIPHNRGPGGLSK